MTARCTRYAQYERRLSGAQPGHERTQATGPETDYFLVELSSNIRKYSIRIGPVICFSFIWLFYQD